MANPITIHLISILNSLNQLKTFCFKSFIYNFALGAHQQILWDLYVKTGSAQLVTITFTTSQFNSVFAFSIKASRLSVFCRVNSFASFSFFFFNLYHQIKKIKVSYYGLISDFIRNEFFARIIMNFRSHSSNHFEF